MYAAHYAQQSSCDMLLRCLQGVQPLAGCGMCAVPFNDLQKDNLKLKDLQKIQRLVKERIPTGTAADNTL